MSLLSQYHFKGRQEQAATEPNPAIAVTAGAGSGKTLSLVGRYLYLLEQGYPLRSILAITFTEKAAREMRARIRKALAYISAEELTAENQRKTLKPLAILVVPILTRAASAPSTACAPRFCAPILLRRVSTRPLASRRRTGRRATSQIYRISAGLGRQRAGRRGAVWRFQGRRLAADPCRIVEPPPGCFPSPHIGRGLKCDERFRIFAFRLPRHAP